MLDLMKENRLPIGISVGALALATYFGLLPVMQNSTDTSSAASTDIAALEDRINALEANATGPVASNDIPEGADNARLRQEIDLIVRGLSNQTGRVSRLRDVVEGITDEGGQLIPSALVLDEIALAKRGLANLTRRINELTDRMDALDTAAADITRLQQQMALVDRALARVAANTNAARDERAALMTAVSPASQGTGSSASAPASAAADLEDITAKLDAILQQLGN